jgi:hypothetical protein
VNVGVRIHANSHPSNQRVMLTVSLPDLDREILELKREEAKLIKDIKAAAKTGNQASMRVLAKSLVRLRGQVRDQKKRLCPQVRQTWCMLLPHCVHAFQGTSRALCVHADRQDAGQ